MKKSLSTLLLLSLLISLFLYGCVAPSDTDTTGKITAIELCDIPDGAYELLVGDEKTGYFWIVGTTDFTPEDIEIVVEDTDVATVEHYDKESVSKFYYKITAVGVGSTDFYARTVDGEILSDTLTVFVDEEEDGAPPSEIPDPPINPPLPAPEEDEDFPDEGTEEEGKTPEVPALTKPTLTLDAIPEYSGETYVHINGGIPHFTENQITDSSYEYYSDLDSLGRCGIAVACIGKDIMPTEARGDIGSVTPSGWHSVKYDIVSGKYLYNRSHLIGWQLTGENANEKNLITGTKTLNSYGMLPFENMIADYIKETGNHVMMRVTPIYDGENLLASGVQMEAYSVEDDGEGICINVFIYNNEPGIVINYKDGSSALENAPDTPDTPDPPSEAQKYILNTNTKKFHKEGCKSAEKISDKNRGEHYGTREELIADGYSPCGNCDP